MILRLLAVAGVVAGADNRRIASGSVRAGGRQGWC
jgi:hypothetical protein